MDCNTRALLALTMVFTLASCTYNPFTFNNHLTGSPVGTAVGGAAGAGTVALAGGSKTFIALGGVGGAMLGYYVTSLRFDSGGVLRSGGQVFTLGDYATINIPSDQLFDTNSAEFLDSAGPILDSAVAVLKRYPNDNIIVSGNTSGFSTARFERKLSEDRARQVAGYLWAHGINEFRGQSLKMRKLTYAGYGNYFPIANDIHNDSIRQNSHIQITAYPTKDQLQIDKHRRAFNNVGGLDDETCKDGSSTNFGNQFSEVLNEGGVSRRDDLKDTYNEGAINNSITPSMPERPTYRDRRNLKDEKDENVWGSYSNSTNAPQTTFGGNLEKQGGFTNFKDESPR